MKIGIPVTLTPQFVLSQNPQLGQPALRLLLEKGYKFSYIPCAKTHWHFTQTTFHYISHKDCDHFNPSLSSPVWLSRTHHLGI